MQVSWSKQKIKLINYTYQNLTCLPVSAEVSVNFNTTVSINNILQVLPRKDCKICSTTGSNFISNCFQGFSYIDFKMVFKIVPPDFMTISSESKGIFYQ